MASERIEILAESMRTWRWAAMKCYGSIALLWCLLMLPRSGAGEGIEKVSYLLQYGPGVHTVFEQEDTSNKTVTNTKDRVASPVTTPSTLTSKPTTSELMTQVSHSSTWGPAEPSAVNHHTPNTGELHPNGAVIESVANTAAPIIAQVNSTDKNGDTQASTINANEQRPGDVADGSTADDRRRNPHPKCRTPVSVLQKLPPLPLPPVLPTFGAVLRSDVVVNLKPKELRTLMSTYIALIEAYKSFNQQQKRNIAHLEEELARHALITGRTERLRNTKIEILNQVANIV